MALNLHRPDRRRGRFVISSPPHSTGRHVDRTLCPCDRHRGGDSADQAGQHFPSMVTRSLIPTASSRSTPSTSIVIVGGGVIGTEYASILAMIGVRVILIDKRPRLLEFVDVQIIDALQRQTTRHRRHTLPCGRSRRDREGAGRTGHGLADTPRRSDHDDDARRYAIGRIGATKRCSLEEVGIMPDARGRVIVNDHFQTLVPYLRCRRRHRLSRLASTSMQQGRHASCHAFGHPDHTETDLLPVYGIYAIPGISTVGRNEEELTKAGVPYGSASRTIGEIARRAADRR